MDYSIIINYLITIGPAITAIITAICTMIAAFKKIKDATETTNLESRQIKREVSAVIKENAELKQELTRTLRKVHMVRDDDDYTK